MKKIIINVVLALLFAVLMIGVFIIRFAPPPKYGTNVAIFLYLLTVPVIFSHYAVLWRSVYHILTDRPHKIIYTVVDVISIISMALAVYILIGTFIFYKNIINTTFLSWYIEAFGMLWLPFAFMALRAVCFAVYKVVEHHKTPLPAGDSTSEIQLP